MERKEEKDIISTVMLTYVWRGTGDVSHTHTPHLYSKHT